jgi:hypothetical protein
MALTKNNIYAKPEQDQNVRIAPGSPLALIGLFVELIRKRFSADSGLPWVWDNDVKKTGLAIESAFVGTTEHRDFSPAIFVDKEDTVIGRTVVGDRAGAVLTSQQDVFYGLASVPMSIEVISSTRAESTIIADIVQYFLHASSDLIQSKFNLHEMTPVTLQKCVPFERDTELWTTSITFTIQFTVRWSTKPFQPLLQQIQLDIQKSESESATEYFESIVFSYEKPVPTE